MTTKFVTFAIPSGVSQIMMGNPGRLLFVYNADGGLLNAVRDMAHKIAAPESYPCSLCAITYGWVAMHGRWRRFLDSLPHDKAFHHRDDFIAAFPHCDAALPAILLERHSAPPCVLISAEELDALTDLGALISLLEQRLALTRSGAPSPAAQP
jgi:hypothetical protein